VSEGTNVESLARAAYQRHGKSPPPDMSDETLEEGAWLLELRHTGQGRVASTIDNLHRILITDSRWRDVLTWCDFSYRVEKQNAPPWDDASRGEWRDIDTSRLKIWLGRHYGVAATTSDLDDTVLVAASERAVHPVRDHLDGLEWDGEARLAHWLVDYLGAARTPYVEVVGKLFLLSAVARVYQPGCKADGVLILEGAQGIGKSSAVRTLADPWFTDSHFALGEKDGYHILQGVWICELAELDSFNKAESTRAKQFFASRSDRFRPVYGRRAEDCPRQCVFVGTTNMGSYLKDATGNRRYWPVKCSALEVDGLASVRDQLWAEAVHRYLAGEPWWPSDEEVRLFESEQDRRYQVDPWEELFEEWCVEPLNRTRSWFTLTEILAGACKLEPHQMKPPEQQRMGQVLQRLGWGRVRKRVENTTGVGPGRRAYVYLRPESSIVQALGDDDA